MAETGDSEKEKEWDWSNIIPRIKSSIQELELAAILVLLFMVVFRIFRQIASAGNKFTVNPKDLLVGQSQTTQLWTGIIEIFGIIAMLILAGLILLAFVKIRRED